MGLLDWLAAPKAHILYTDDKGQHRLTAEQYGEKCVNWAVGIGRLKSQNLAAYGKVRDNEDVIAKIHCFPDSSVVHGTAFFVAVYCAYPVVRLGISNELFKDVMKGANNAILRGGHIFNGQPRSQAYLQHLSAEMRQYTATLLESAGMPLQPEGDRLLFGIGGACHRLICSLEHEYAGVQIPERGKNNETNPTNESIKLTGKNVSDSSINISTVEARQPTDTEIKLWAVIAKANAQRPPPKVIGKLGDGKSPFIEATRNKTPETLLMATFANSATQFVKATDDHRNLVLLQ